MPNVLDAEGLQTATREELVTYFTEKYQQIYGDDINLDSNTPDGQMLNIFVQATIQTKVQSIAGLENVIVTGTLLTQSLTFSNLGDLDELIGCRFTTVFEVKMTCEYQNVKKATGIDGEFVFTPENVFLLPMQLVPRNQQVASGDTLQFTGKGGYGTYIYAFIGFPPSGTTIDEATGILTAGGTPGTATVRATDSFGNTGSTSVEII